MTSLLQLPAKSDSSLTTIMPGLTFQWLKGGRIAAFTLTSHAHQVIESYFQANYSLMDEAERTPDEWMVMLHDISDKNIVMTPLFKNRLDEIAARIRTGQVQFRTAIVLAKSPMSMVFSIFGNTFSHRAKNTVQKFFTSREAAIEWLEEFIA